MNSVMQNAKGEMQRLNAKGNTARDSQVVSEHHLNFEFCILDYEEY